jgi:hypothetical protein
MLRHLRLYEFACGNSRLFKLVSILCVAILLFSSVSFFEMMSEEKVPLSALKSKIAVIYAKPTFHDEVVSAKACMLHDLGYYVVVYIGNGVHVGDMLLPFSERRKRNSQDFYGRCVSQWVTISDHMSFVPNIDILVFVTYPMLVHGMKPDTHALDMLTYYKDRTPNFPIVLVTHRSQEMLGLNGELEMVEAIIPRERLTFLFLGEHTAKGAKSFLASVISDGGNSSSHKNSKAMAKFVRSVDSFRIEYVYPVIPKDYVVSDSMEFYTYTSMIEHCWHIIWNIFSSGLVTRKTDPPKPIASTPPITSASTGDNKGSDVYHPTSKLSNRDLCSNATLQAYPGAPVHESFVSAVSSHSFLSASGKQRNPSSTGALFSVQGNFGGKHAYRKDPLSIVTCLKKIESAVIRAYDLDQRGVCKSDSKEVPFSVQPTGPRFRSRHLSVTNSSESASVSHGRSGKFPFEVSLDLIGHLDGDIDISENSFKSGKLRFLSDLDSKSYYTAISRTRFMVAGLKDHEYLTTRATSSIPAALIAQVPVVMTREYLEIYPCLRDQKIHRKIARNSECESVEVAFWLTPEEYLQAVEESRFCSSQLWEQAKATFQKIITAAKSNP